jgi:hypothetical protein
VHLEMGLLRLVNAARLAPLEELLAETRGSGGAGGGASGKTPVRTASAGASGFGSQFPSRVLGASAQANVLVPQKAPASESGRYTGSATNAFGAGSGTAAGVAPARVAESSEEGLEISTVANSGGASFGAQTGIIPQKARDGAELPVPQKAPASESGRYTEQENISGGITAEQVAEIKAAIQAQQKFIGELLEHGSRWELEGSELRIYFAPEKSTFAGLIEGRETLEKIRAASGKVLGRTVRVCARLESSAGKEEKSPRGTLQTGSRAGSVQEMRAQFENDPMVKSMLERFGGRISEVRRQTEE